MNINSSYQAKIVAPFGVLGICCTEDTLIGIDFLQTGTALLKPSSQFAQAVHEQLLAYLKDPDFKFEIPLNIAGSEYQRKVWQAMRAIPRGQTMQYGELAKKLESSPRAIGGACGANPIPIVIPCHRVVSKTGMGGFAHHREGYMLDIKRWLLAHEQR